MSNALISKLALCSFFMRVSFIESLFPKLIKITCVNVTRIYKKDKNMTKPNISCIFMAGNSSDICSEEDVDLHAVLSVTQWSIWLKAFKHPTTFTDADSSKLQNHKNNCLEETDVTRMGCFHPTCFIWFLNSLMLVTVAWWCCLDMSDGTNSCCEGSHQREERD